MIDTTELRRLHAESSGGEWKAVENSCYCEIRHDNGEYFSQIGDMCASVHIGIPEGTENEQGNRALSTANATFIAAAHNAMPALCDELDAARSRVAELEAMIDGHKALSQEQPMKRHLETSYNDYAAKVMSPNAGPVQRKETRQAFFVGACAVLEILNKATQNEAIEETIIGELQAEIESFTDSVMTAGKVKP